ncbi:MAG: DUF3857 domain-containing protein [Bacteroidales bacterium]
MKLPTFKSAILLIFLATCTISNAFAIKDPIKFGKVSLEELKMTSYDQDTTAAAVYLCDFGRYDIPFDKVEGNFKFVFTRIVRIKILKDEGLDYSTLEFGYNKTRQNVSMVKACTYNLENGKIVKTKLSSKDRILEKTADNYFTYKLTLPKVKPGSVVEFTYEISTDFAWNLRPWYFQKDIPVVWSEYRINLPEYFDYKKQAKGYLPFHAAEQNFATGSIGSDISYSISKYRWVVKDAPSFKKEPFTTTSKNYKSAIEFELAGVKGLNGVYHDKTGTWDKINKSLLKNEYFGTQLKGGAYLKDIVEEINAKASTDQEKMMAAFDFIKKHMKWDEYNSKFTTNTLRSAFKDKKGNAADINLMLVVLLRKLGLKADPVILSTRNNGVLNLVSPSLSKFNYVITRCELDRAPILMDATNPNCPCNLLPLRCINDRGRVISESGSYFIDIEAKNISKSIAIAKMNLSEDGVISGNMKLAFNGSAALNFRNKMEGLSEDEIIKNLSDDYESVNIESVDIQNLKETEKSITTSLDIEMEEETDMGNDLIYLNPILFDRTESNPFTLEERKYPVDYGYPIDRTYMLELNLPEGYTLESIPKPAKIALPENSASFMYTVNQLGSKVTIMCRMKINKRQFQYNEYPFLKEFYNLIVAKNGEMLVLKKS